MVKKKRILVVVIVLGVLLAVLGSLSILSIIDLIILPQGVLAFVSEHLWGTIIFLFGGIGLWVIGLVIKWYFGKKEERKKLASLLDELKQNKRLAEKEGRSGYQFSAYEDTKRANYLLNLSGNLKDKIGEVYTKILAFYNDKENVNFPVEIPELKELLEDIIPKFEEYLKKL